MQTKTHEGNDTPVLSWKKNRRTVRQRLLEGEKRADKLAQQIKRGADVSDEDRTWFDAHERHRKCEDSYQLFLRGKCAEGPDSDKAVHLSRSGYRRYCREQLRSDPGTWPEERDETQAGTLKRAQEQTQQRRYLCFHPHVLKAVLKANKKIRKKRQDDSSRNNSLTRRGATIADLHAAWFIYWLTQQIDQRIKDRINKHPGEPMPWHTKHVWQPAEIMAAMLGLSIHEFREAKRRALRTGLVKAKAEHDNGYNRVHFYSLTEPGEQIDDFTGLMFWRVRIEWLKEVGLTAACVVQNFFGHTVDNLKQGRGLDDRGQCWRYDDLASLRVRGLQNLFSYDQVQQAVRKLAKMGWILIDYCGKDQRSPSRKYALGKMLMTAALKAAGFELVTGSQPQAKICRKQAQMASQMDTDVRTSKTHTLDSSDRAIALGAAGAAPSEESKKPASEPPVAASQPSLSTFFLIKTKRMEKENILDRVTKIYRDCYKAFFLAEPPSLGSPGKLLRKVRDQNVTVQRYVFAGLLASVKEGYDKETFNSTCLYKGEVAATAKVLIQVTRQRYANSMESYLFLDSNVAKKNQYSWDKVQKRLDLLKDGKTLQEIERSESVIMKSTQDAAKRSSDGKNSPERSEALAVATAQVRAVTPSDAPEAQDGDAQEAFWELPEPPWWWRSYEATSWRQQAWEKADFHARAVGQPPPAASKPTPEKLEEMARVRSENEARLQVQRDRNKQRDQEAVRAVSEMANRCLKERERELIEEERLCKVDPLRRDEFDGDAGPAIALNPTEHLDGLALLEAERKLAGWQPKETIPGGKTTKEMLREVVELLESA